MEIDKDYSQEGRKEFYTLMDSKKKEIESLDISENYKNNLSNLVKETIERYEENRISYLNHEKKEEHERKEYQERNEQIASNTGDSSPGIIEDNRKIEEAVKKNNPFERLSKVIKRITAKGRRTGEIIEDTNLELKLTSFDLEATAKKIKKNIGLR